MTDLDLSDVKGYLNITAPTYDSDLSTVLSASIAAVATRVGPLEATPLVARVAGGSSVLRLPVYPVISVETVTASDGSTVPLGDLHYDAAGVITRANDWQGFPQFGYDVAYTAGWDDCPDDLLLAVKELVRHLWQANQRGSGRPGSGASETTSNTVPGAAYLFPFRVEQLIAPYVSPRVA